MRSGLDDSQTVGAGLKPAPTWASIRRPLSSCSFVENPVLANHFEVGLNRRGVGYRLGNGRTLHRQPPDFPQSSFVGICPDKALGRDSSIARVAFILDAGPFADVVKVALHGHLQIMDADALFRGVDHEAHGHAASNGRQQLLVGAGGHVGGGQVARFVHVYLVVAHVGAGAHPALPGNSGFPGAGYGVKDIRVLEGLQHLESASPGEDRSESRSASTISFSFFIYIDGQDLTGFGYGVRGNIVVGGETPRQIQSNVLYILLIQV